MNLNYKTRFFNQITFRVLLIFGTMLGYSVLMDYLDLKQMLDNNCAIYEAMECKNNNPFNEIDYPVGYKHTHWSSHHYIYFFMNIGLMIIQLLRLRSFVLSNVDSDLKITYKK